MILYAAIDIQDNKVVRLKQGRFQDKTQYAADPVKVAQKWEQAGAPWLHVIDLDGARSGSPQNTETIIKIAQAVAVPVQCGGGIRTEAEIATLLDAGIARVVLGTQAIKDLEFLRNLLARWPEKITVSLDCKDGYLTTKGWTKITHIKATDFARDLERMGLTCLIYTDIKTDGMLSGPNYAALKELLEAVTLPVIASGGIKDMRDIEQLRDMEPLGITGAITGRAIYEGTLDLKDAIQLCSQKG
ncbi:MAG: 1-(5-phosphoribosyl)-5-[(5-phosphoribosylamino)methylideneamino]imidazole-4-carboxamide isomerase [Candidatus Omnitrophota bacterium]|jgi:phosphoribosylformimino-5-aminoimidazole carboxamide ribotide isomerase